MLYRRLGALGRRLRYKKNATRARHSLPKDFGISPPPHKLTREDKLALLEVAAFEAVFFLTPPLVGMLISPSVGAAIAVVFIVVFTVWGVWGLHKEEQKCWKKVV